MNLPTILVTEPEFSKAEAIFRSAAGFRCEPVPPEEAALAESVKKHGVRAVIVGIGPYGGPLYEALGRNGQAIIARFGVGHDNIDKTLARQHGIVVTNTPGVLDESVAEHSIWLMGCLARHVAQLDARMRSGQFHDQTGIELRRKTLGILGLGSIGRRVAAIAHFGFGMRVVACGHRNTAERLAEDGIENYTTCVEEVFRRCDILSVHLRSDASTRRFVNSEKLSWMKPGALLINTSRGAVLDESALFDAVATGRLAGAALDVFEYEPYRPVHLGQDLRTLPNVLLTPHIASNTREANARMAKAAVHNVRHFIACEWELLARVDQV